LYSSLARAPFTPVISVRASTCAHTHTYIHACMHVYTLLRDQLCDNCWNMCVILLVSQQILNNSLPTHGVRRTSHKLPPRWLLPVDKPMLKNSKGCHCDSE
jgi:hypothetical protein